MSWRQPHRCLRARRSMPLTGAMVFSRRALTFCLRSSARLNADNAASRPQRFTLLALSLRKARNTAK